MKLKYMALFGHLSALLLALVIIKETAAEVFDFLMETLGGFLSSSSPEAGASSALFTLPASLFLLLIFILFVILVCQAPALVGTKMVMDRDK